MSWDSKYINFGVLKTDGDKVHVYCDKNNYITIYVGANVVNATWAGGEINAYLSNGKVQRYSDKNNYQTIY